MRAEAGKSAVSRSGQASTRVIVGAVVGGAAAAATGLLGSWDYAPSIGWVAGAAVFLGWTIAVISGMDSSQTAAHATREDPSRRASLLLVLGASLASLAGVGYLLVQASNDKGSSRWLSAGLGVVSVAVSWLVVHVLFTLHYALLYYEHGRADGVDFNQKEPPRYTDFAYLAFTVGMTFQVSDTEITTHRLRTTVLRHALLSFLFGALILAATVNLVASLASTTH